MTRRKALVMIFLSSLLLCITFSSILVSIVMFEDGEVLIEPSNMILVLIVIANLVLCLSSFYSLLNDIRLKLNDGKEKEKSVKECYQYEQLLNPPVMNN